MPPDENLELEASWGPSPPKATVVEGDQFQPDLFENLRDVACAVQHCDDGRTGHRQGRTRPDRNGTLPELQRTVSKSWGAWPMAWPANASSTNASSRARARPFIAASNAVGGDEVQQWPRYPAWAQLGVRRYTLALTRALSSIAWSRGRLRSCPWLRRRRRSTPGLRIQPAATGHPPPRQQNLHPAPSAGEGPLARPRWRCCRDRSRPWRRRSPPARRQ